MSLVEGSAGLPGEKSKAPKNQKGDLVMLSKLHKRMLLLAAAVGIALFAGSAGLAGDPPTKTIKVNPAAISQFKAPGKTAVSPADLEATVFVMNNQNLPPWTVRGVVKNVGGRAFSGKRLVTLYQIDGSYGPKGRRPKYTTLATMTVTSLKGGQSLKVEKAFTVQPYVGTKFQLVISPGDLNPANDAATITFRGT
jgi:hypothetical protein